MHFPICHTFCLPPISISIYIHMYIYIIYIYIYICPFYGPIYGRRLCHHIICCPNLFITPPYATHHVLPHHIICYPISYVTPSFATPYHMLPHHIICYIISSIYCNITPIQAFEIKCPREKHTHTNIYIYICHPRSKQTLPWML
jgi:hypothetical protein